MTATRLPSRWSLLVALTAFVASIVVVNVPTTSTVAIDYVPRTVTQPLYAKAIAFVDRDIQMRQIAASIMGDARDQQENADRILRWTHTNIRPTPPGMPVVDDHPYNVVVRGYGNVDQAADVFAVLAGYGGMPGGLVFSRTQDGSALYAFALIEIDGENRVFDVREGRALRDRNGRLATVDQLRADPTLTDDLPAPSEARGVPYPTLIASLDAGPHRTSADQMPLQRLVNEVGRLLSRR